MPEEYFRPLPVRYPEDIEHLDGAIEHRLRIPRCRTCGRSFWPSGPVCPYDFSREIEWSTDSGNGVITSWVRYHKQYFAGGDDVPYYVVQAELKSGPRLTTSWSAVVAPTIGMSVGVAFRQFGESVYLPEFTPLDDQTTNAQMSKDYE